MPFIELVDPGVRVPGARYGLAAIAAVLGSCLLNTAHATLICVAPGCVIDDDVSVGSAGSGDGLLVISTPSSVTVGGAVTIGAGGPDEGNATVTGPGALLEAGGVTDSRMFIGTSGGTGTLTILDGGTVALRAHDPDEVSFLNALVGSGGNGEIEIASGGSLVIRDVSGAVGPGEFAALGVGTGFQGQDGIGAVRVTGDESAITIEAFASVLTIGAASNVFTGGGAGTGSLEVLDGAEVNVLGGTGIAVWHIGAGGGASGTATVSGDGSEVSVIGGSGAQVLLGGDGADAEGTTGVGTLRVTDNGRVVVDAAEDEADVIVGHGLGTGLLQVDGGGQVVIDGNLRVSANNDDSGNDQQTGVMLIHGEGTVTTTGTTYVGNGTSPTVNGYLCGTGTLITDQVIIQSGGMVCPGFSPGALNIVGDLIFDGGLFEVEIAGFGAGMFDTLNVTGLVDLTNANILFKFLDGFLPTANFGAFDFISANSILGLSSATFMYEGAPADFRFNLRERNGVLTAAVPEPGSLALLMAGLLALRAARFRREPTRQ